VDHGRDIALAGGGVAAFRIVEGFGVSYTKARMLVTRSLKVEGLEPTPVTGSCLRQTNTPIRRGITRPVYTSPSFANRRISLTATIH
jgi:hypothetical protein